MSEKYSICSKHQTPANDCPLCLTFIDDFAKAHEHEYEPGMVSLGYAMAGKGHLAMCKICRKDFNKETGELEEAF